MTIQKDAPQVIRPPHPSDEHNFRLLVTNKSEDGLFLLAIYAADLPDGAVTVHDPRVRLAQLLHESAESILRDIPTGTAHS